MLRCSTRLALEIFDYQNKYETLIEDGYTNDLGPGIIKILPPNQLKNFSRSLFGTANNSNKNDLLKQFQQGMFIVITMCSFCLVTIPACGNAIVYRKSRETWKIIILCTIKTTIIVTGVHFLIRKAYFVDTSEAIGMAALFMFILSLILSYVAIDPTQTQTKS